MCRVQIHTEPVGVPARDQRLAERTGRVQQLREPGRQ